MAVLGGNVKFRVVTLKFGWRGYRTHPAVWADGVHARVFKRAVGGQHAQPTAHCEVYIQGQVYLRASSADAKCKQPDERPIQSTTTSIRLMGEARSNSR